MRRHHRKHFSLKQAQSKLRQIFPLLRNIIKLKTRVDALGFPVYQHQYFGGMGPNGHGEYPLELEELVDQLQLIEQEGIQVKGLDPVLLDFPHIRENNEEVYLCWHAGEPEILYWHRISDGFAGRQSVATL